MRKQPVFSMQKVTMLHKNYCLARFSGKIDEKVLNARER